MHYIFSWIVLHFRRSVLHSRPLSVPVSFFRRIRTHCFRWKSLKETNNSSSWVHRRYEEVCWLDRGEGVCWSPSENRKAQQRALYTIWKVKNGSLIRLKERDEDAHGENIVNSGPFISSLLIQTVTFNYGWDAENLRDRMQMKGLGSADRCMKYTANDGTHSWQYWLG